MEDDEEQGVGSEHCSATSDDVSDAKTSYRQKAFTNTLVPLV